MRTSADVIEFVDEMSVLIRADNGVRCVLVRVEGDVPHTLRYVVRPLDRGARDWGRQERRLRARSCMNVCR